jgi:tripartite-type tricarboxylate transporter receptor subunit TctC
MKLCRRELLHLAAGAAALPALLRTASAQIYPNRHVRFILPFPPGGSAAQIARSRFCPARHTW